MEPIGGKEAPEVTVADGMESITVTVTAVGGGAKVADEALRAVVLSARAYNA